MVILSLAKIIEKNAVDVLEQAKDVLDRYRIQYWLDSGTLLGSFRDGKFIEWDNDIDLGSFETDLNKMEFEFEDLKKKGFYIYIGNSVTLIKKKVIISIYHYFLDEKSDNFIRKTIMSKKNLLSKIIYRIYVVFYTSYFFKYKTDFHYTPYSNLTNNIIKCLGILPHVFLLKIAKMILFLSDKIGLCKTWIIPSKFYNDLSTINFYDMDFKIPSSIEKYLEYRYGKDWKTPRENWDTNTEDGAIRKLFF
jgi:phosphorylcholine metabolism protein LicD